MALFSQSLFPVEVGQVIKIWGKALAAPDRIIIDLAKGNGTDFGSNYGDVALHLSAWFDTRKIIIRNSHTPGQGWGKEEITENLFPNNQEFPFKGETNFKVAIFVELEAFFVSVNDKPYCRYPHRKPLSDINKVIVPRGVEAIYQVDQITARPNQWPKKNENVFSGLFPKPLKAGHVIVITGCPRLKRGNFVFNLHTGGLNRILFHLRPYIGSNQITAAERDAEGNWKSHHQVNPSPYPFNVDQRFKLAIGFANQNITVALDGKMILSFPYGNSNEIFSSATGFEICANDGMRMQIQSVDHLMQHDCSCSCIEKYST